MNHNQELIDPSESKERMRKQSLSPLEFQHHPKEKKFPYMHILLDRELDLVINLIGMNQIPNIMIACTFFFSFSFFLGKNYTMLV
jgi:hypothetical protein